MFEWDDQNVQHIGRHRIEPEEVEEALLDAARIGVGGYNGGSESRSAYIGATDAGRILFVVTTRRNRRIRVVTARDASARNRRQYRRGGRA